MKKKTVRMIIFSGIALLLVSASFMGYNIWQEVNGSEEINEKQDNIPEVQTKLSPVEKGKNDWNSWHGTSFDRKSNYTGIKKDWSGGLKKLWEVSFLCQGSRTVSWSAPVIQGNRLVVPGRDELNDLVFCLNPKNGDLIWKGEYKAETETNHGPGARATPFIDDDKVFTFGRNGDLVCWELYDGKMLWKKSVKDEGGEEPIWGHSSSPLVYKNKVFVQGGGNSLALAYDKITGKTLWKSMTGNAGYAPPTFFYSGNDTLILFFQGMGLSALNPENGKELWTIAHETDYDVNASLPQITNDTIFITSAYGKGCRAIKADNKKAETIWESKIIEGQHTDPVIINGYIYAYSGESTQNKGNLKCVRLSDGKEMWSSNETGYGTLIYIDKHLICLDLKGNLYLVEVNPKRFIKVAEMKKAVPKVRRRAWTSPITAGGKLYLRYMQRLICYEL